MQEPIEEWFSTPEFKGYLVQGLSDASIQVLLAQSNRILRRSSFVDTHGMKCTVLQSNGARVYELLDGIPNDVFQRSVRIRNLGCAFIKQVKHLRATRKDATILKAAKKKLKAKKLNDARIAAMMTSLAHEELAPAAATLESPTSAFPMSPATLSAQMASVSEHASRASTYPAAAVLSALAGLSAPRATAILSEAAGTSALPEPAASSLSELLAKLPESAAAALSAPATQCLLCANDVNIAESRTDSLSLWHDKCLEAAISDPKAFGLADTIDVPAYCAQLAEQSENLRLAVIRCTKHKRPRSRQ